MVEGRYYTYLWLRYDGTPYYAGKGKGRRAFIRQSHRAFPPLNKTYIILQYFETEKDAYAAEKFLILYFGRKVNGTGCLRNLHEGGRRGGSRTGIPCTDSMRAKISKSLLGHPVSEETKAKIRLARSRQTIVPGYKWTPDARLRLSEAKKGKRVSPSTEFKPGFTPWNKGRKFAA